MTEVEELFRKFSYADTTASQNVDPNQIMTKQEVHDFGVEIIENYSQQEGFEIVSVSKLLNQNPQIVLKKSGELFFVMVKTGPADVSYKNYDKDLA